MGGFITANGTFFDHIWSEYLDDSFLFHLEMAALSSQRSINFGDDAVFESVLRNMYFYTNHVLSMGDIHRRFKLANLRYHTWKGIMEHEAVTYDPATYSVKCSNWTWIELHEAYELAEAYHKVNMERMWPELCIIFGPDEARVPDWKKNLPKKPPRAFELIRANGTRLPTIDEILADYMAEEKRKYDEKQRRELKKKGIKIEDLPPDCMSTTKGHGIELLPAREVLTISPEVQRSTGATTSANGASRAKKALHF